jgi:hypothetical protein
MKSSSKDIDRIEDALIAAHQRKEGLPFPPDWRQRVMQEIRSLAEASASPQEPERKTITPRRIAAWAALSLAVVVGLLILANKDWEDPYLCLKRDIVSLKSHAVLWLEAGDKDSGLRNLTVTILQGEQRIEVYSRNFQEPGWTWFSKSEAVKKMIIPLVINTQDLGLQEGEATVIVTARDLSWSNGFKGRQTTLTKKISVCYD